MVRIDLVGKKIGRLTVIERAEDYVNPTSGWRIVRYLCKCECGKEIVTLRGGLRNGSTLSCGCYRRDLLASNATKHGLLSKGKRPSEYQSWTSMKQRCFNPKAESYEDYGGRGITVCDRWKNSYENFYADMGQKPGPTYSIDRINVNGNYEPGNCRWATKSEQFSNTRWKRIEEFSTEDLLLELARRQAIVT